MINQFLDVVSRSRTRRDQKQPEEERKDETLSNYYNLTPSFEPAK